MARKAGRQESAPDSFTLSGAEPLKYKIELITPMAGGGTKSWQPDLNNPVRSQAIKGQLRYWWRTLQNEADARALKQREDILWGATDNASAVRLQVKLVEKVTVTNIIDIQKNEKGILQFDSEGLPGYVLFPLQGQKDLPVFQLLQNIYFEISLQVPDEYRTELENSVKLWLLFGGLGARNSRGCGSLYCETVMQEFSGTAAINNYIQGLLPADAAEFGASPYPVISNCRLATAEVNSENPTATWAGYLRAFGDFRQKAGVGRNPGKGKQPGRTRWPEADAIRRITRKASPNHQPVHPAGNWFPRGAYGLPIMTEFRGAPGDPRGKISLVPSGGRGETKERWPSPVVLKVIKLDENRLLKVCLILNHVVPENLELCQDGRKIHDLSAAEQPMAFADKTMPENARMMHSGAPPYAAMNPYDALIRHLNLTEERP